MPGEDVVFLVNPASANGATGKRWPEIERRAAAAGLRGETLVSARPGHLVELAAQAARSGARLLVAVGGDGTVNEAVNGLLQAAAPDGVELAVIPRGTGRDFARSFGVPADVDGAIAVARDGTVRAVDVGLARFSRWDGSPAESYFVNFGGAGISGAIARRANASSKALGGRVSFIWATVAVFARWQSADVTVTVDGEERAGRMFEVLVQNGEFTAGGMWVTPGAAPDDGLFDILLIGDVTKADFARTFPKVYRGSHLGHPKIDRLSGRRVAVDSPARLPIALDGEQPGTTPVEFDVVPRALRVRVPA
ncbi:MAG TPA: diacylglycerol kinase family protein [Gaiellaceae bacterium]|nr:diacylglycerol kinase family protein [Gaiellaceae bacterium]